MNNYENSHHDGIAPIVPILDGSMEANLNNDNISDSQLNIVADKTMNMINAKDIIDSSNSSPINIANITNKTEVNNQYSINNTITNQELVSTDISSDIQSNNIISVVKYLKYIIIFNIPIINVIIIIKTLNTKDDVNISNLAKSYLILLIISIVLFVIIKIF